MTAPARAAEPVRHFLVDTDLSPDEQAEVLDLAAEMNGEEPRA